MSLHVLIIYIVLGEVSGICLAVPGIVPLSGPWCKIGKKNPKVTFNIDNLGSGYHSTAVYIDASGKRLYLENPECAKIKGRKETDHQSRQNSTYLRTDTQYLFA
jgi:hypothetical protein